MSFAIYPPNSTIPLRHYLFDGVVQRVDKTVQCSIVRESDGHFWTGSTWQAAEIQIAMSQVNKTSVHWVGVYQYDFVVDANEMFYDWQSTFTDADGWASVDRGTIEVRNRARVDAELALNTYDGPTNTEMLSAFTDLPASVVAAIMAKTVDGVTYETLLECVQAVLYGEAEPESPGVVVFKKRDGSTVKCRITYGTAQGSRTNSEIV